MSKKISTWIRFILHLGVAIYLFSQYIGFYTTDSSSFSVSQQTGGIRILYANIFKDNTRYDELLDIIKFYDPDVILFVEYSDEHDKVLGEYLYDEYPYSNRINWSNRFIGNVVVSRYPTTNLARDFDFGEWRYGYVSINAFDTDYYIYLVHTSAPNTYENWIARDRHIHRFENDIKEDALSRANDAAVLVVGDFNVSPWSPAYVSVDTAISGYNITRESYGVFTWCVAGIGLVCAHIDHVWLGGDIDLLHREKIDIPGSDHDGILFDVY